MEQTGASGRWVRRGRSLVLLDVGGAGGDHGAAEAEVGSWFWKKWAPVQPRLSPQSVSFFSRGADLKFLGTWTVPQAGPSVHLIDEAAYASTVATLTYPPLRQPGARWPGGGPPSRATYGDLDPADMQERLALYEAMVRKLIAAAATVTIAPRPDQRQALTALYADAKAQNLEQVLFLLLDLRAARMSMVRARGVTATSREANIPLGRVPGTNIRTLPPPAGSASLQVIGNVHTHYLSAPSVRTVPGGTVRTTMGYGVSAIDVTSARTDGIVVYALDDRYLHRANPDGTKDDKLGRDFDVLLDALEVFSGKPRAQRAYVPPARRP
jgi:hypothetical protein